MTIQTGAKPLPHPTALAQPFWKALKNRELRLQRCAGCQAFHHPPKIICPRCHAKTFEWERVDASGTLYSYSIVHRAPVPAFQADVPYAVGLVDIGDTGVRLLSNLRVPLDKIKVDMPLDVCFYEAGDFTLFAFSLPGDRESCQGDR